MQFTHPALLYALFLLLIPIIIHLFQLRKFKKTPFSNVAFLKKIVTQTRKSKSIKKWLILATRLFLFACLIVAFAQPFIPESDTATAPYETVIYLDNSFSMQAKGSNGSLLRQAAQSLLTALPEEEPFTLLTNDAVFANTTKPIIRNDLVSLPYAKEPLSGSLLSLKAKNYFSKDPTIIKRLVVISDFQSIDPASELATTDFSIYAIPIQTQELSNASIDSVALTAVKNDTYELTVYASANTLFTGLIPITLYNGTSSIAKTSVSFEEDSNQKVTFTIPADVTYQGRILLDDPYLQYDNTFYFAINKQKPIGVTIINGTSDDDFLKRIFRSPEFEVTASRLQNLDFSVLPEQQLIVLNEVIDPSPALINVLKAFQDNGGTLLIIPKELNSSTEYAELFAQLRLPSATAIEDTTLKMTTINYSHPLYTDVFTKAVTNFQYPTVSKSYRFNQSADAILSLENGSPFLFKKNKTYIFTAPLNTNNTNFTNSPLIVPTLYTIGKLSLSLSELYYTIGQPAIFDVATQVNKDQVLTLVNRDDPQIALIPLQQRFALKVSINTQQIPDEAGIYSVLQNEEILQDVAFNYDRSESDLTYSELENIQNIEAFESIDAAFEQLVKTTSTRSLWKWFVIFALFFLLLEILILKFFK